LHQSLMDGYAWVDMNGVIKDFNEAFKLMLGYEDDEIYQLTFLDISPSKWHQTELNIIDKQVLTQGYSEVLRKEYINKDGVIFPVELRIYLSKDENYKPEGMWAIIRDISDVVKAEETQDKLFQQLEELNDSKDKLLSIMAHDLRGPFNSIIGFTELLHTCNQSGDPKVFEDYIYRIENSAKQAHNLLENLLIWANSQTGSLKQQPVLLNINTLIEQTISLLLPSASRKNIEIEVVYSDNLSMEIDPDMFKIIIRNLLSNAIKFTQPWGKVLIKVLLEQNLAKISIQDSGIGISDDMLKVIFHESNFISTKGTLNEGGSGLGIRLCFDLIQRMGGVITAKSNVGQGTTVQIALPIANKVNKPIH
jgi:two-component system sensor histidine kinase/response regulator